METERRFWKAWDDDALWVFVIAFFLIVGGSGYGVSRFTGVEEPTVEVQKTTIAEKAGKKTKETVKDFVKGLTK
jgi:hypothetical protein